MSSRSSNARRPSSKRRRRSSAPSWAERVLTHRFKRIFWLGGIIAALIYGYVFYKYVAPYTPSWKAQYGEQDYPTGYEIHGLDVSHHQGTIHWKEVVTAEIDGRDIEFIFIKATEGANLLDKKFYRNFHQARQHDFIRGAYHFFRPTSSGQQQALHFISKVRLEPGDLPPVLDVEERGTLDVPRLQQEVLAWLRIAERHYGIPPIIYASFKFKQQYLNSPAFDRYPFWIAHYHVKKLRYKGQWKFWQHTEFGRIRGIRGYVDLNVYNGSMYDLRRLTIP